MAAETRCYRVRICASSQNFRTNRQSRLIVFTYIFRSLRRYFFAGLKCGKCEYLVACVLSRVEPTGRPVRKQISVCTSLPRFSVVLADSQTVDRKNALQALRDFVNAI
jgi:hypothetical protein